MNRYLVLSAAALLAGTASAAAGTYCFGFASSNGGSYCDGGIIYTGVDGGTFHNAVRTWKHVNNNCGSGSGEGMGILAKIKGFGDYSTMSDDSFGQNYGIWSEQLEYSLPKKIKDAQPWALWIELDGVSAFEASTGVLTDVTKCQNGRIAGHGRTSTLAAVKSILAARRAN